MFSDISRRFLIPRRRGSALPVPVDRDLRSRDGTSDLRTSTAVASTSFSPRMSCMRRPNVSDALRRSRRSLKPGGVLVLLEITRRPMWLDVVFGLTDGWWQFQDRDVRPVHPLLDGAPWEALLKKIRLRRCRVGRRLEHPGEAAQRVLVARAPSRRRTGRGRRKRAGRSLADARGVAHQGRESHLLGRGRRLHLLGAGESPRRDPSLTGGPFTACVTFRVSTSKKPDTADALLASQRVSCGTALAIVRALGAGAAGAAALARHCWSAGGSRPVRSLSDSPLCGGSAA